MTCHLLSYLSPFCFKNNPVQPFKKIKYSNGAYITSWLQFALLSISLSLTPIRDSLKYYRWYWGYLSLIEVENKGVVAAVKDSKPNSLKIKYTQFVMFILRFVPFQNKQWRQNVCFSQKAIVSRIKLSTQYPTRGMVGVHNTRLLNLFIQWMQPFMIMRSNIIILPWLHSKNERLGRWHSDDFRAMEW